MSELGCQPSGEKMSVWKDDDGWKCEQVVMCLKCHDLWFDTLAEGVEFPEAIAACVKARPEWKP